MKTSSEDRVQLPTRDHVLGKALDKLLDHAWPVAAWLLVIPVAKIIHANWGGVWAAGFTGLCGLLVVLVSVKISHTRGMVTRIMTPLTVTCAFTWLTAAEVTGVSHKMTGFWFIGGLALAVGWQLHTHHHANPAGGVALTLEQAHARAGMRGIKVLSMLIHPKKKTGVMRLPGGKLSADDVAKATSYTEGAAGLPPGSLIVTQNEDNAAHANYTLSDPRILKKPMDWPGPSRPGASIAEPIRPGVWQDGEDVEYVVVGHHVQEMGMTGSGKSTGAGWNEAAEAVTRYDHAELVVDITKGMQFFGVLAPALHALITEDDQVGEFFTDVHACVKDRANYLAAKGLAKWVKGCGLTHLGFQLEECPDIILKLDELDLLEYFMSDVKAFRSAGGRWKLSLQRSDFTQMPTLARGQLAKWCFGVESPGDADFGLSEFQKNANCQPELWTTTHPGKFLLDGPTIPEKYKAMPGRSWYWSEDTSPGSLMGRHAAQYPAAARPLDPVTAKHLAKWLPEQAAAFAGKVPVMAGCPGADTPPDRGPGGGVSPHGGGWTPAPDREVVHISQNPRYQPQPAKEPAMTTPASMWDDPDDDTPGLDPDGEQALAATEEADLTAPVDAITTTFDDDSDAARFDGGDPEPVEDLDADQARDRVMAVLEQVISRNGKAVIGDLAHLPEQLGRSRPWLYYTLDQLTVSRALTVRKGKEGTSWTFTRARRVPAGVSGSDT